VSDNKKLTIQQQQEMNWIKVFNELCYEVFFKDTKGQQLLMMLEQRFFYQPTVYPGKDVAWGYYNEGRNDFIRSIRNAINIFMSQPSRKIEQPNTQISKERVE